MRVFAFLPPLLLGTLVALSLILAAEPSQPRVFLGILGASAFALLLLAVALLRESGWAERVALVVASSALLFVAVFVRGLDLLSLYGLLVLIVLTGQLRGPAEVVRSLRDRDLPPRDAVELRGVLSSILARTGVILLIAVLLSVLVWISLAAFTFAPTSEFTAFLLAALLIVILVLLATLPE
ncbi:MAG: hypothetical protein ACE5KQ_00470 [Thermoplasmata archaeon]